MTIQLFKNFLTGMLLPAAFLILSSASASHAQKSSALPSGSVRATGEKTFAAQKRVGEQLFVRTELLFGTARADETEIREDEWRKFLDEEITARFPDGLTVLSGVGQFRASEASRIVQEKSKVLILLYPLKMRKACNLKIEEIRAAYKTRFGQQSVLRVDDVRPVRVSF